LFKLSNKALGHSL